MPATRRCHDESAPDESAGNMSEPKSQVPFHRLRCQAHDRDSEDEPIAQVDPQRAEGAPQRKKRRVTLLQEAVWAQVVPPARRPFALFMKDQMKKSHPLSGR